MIQVWRKDVDNVLRTKYVDVFDLKSYNDRGWVEDPSGSAKNPVEVKPMPEPPKIVPDIKVKKKGVTYDNENRTY